MSGYVVVGAGLTGATIARELAEDGFKVQVVERREHVAGNAADTAFTHLYGPHIFHTNSDKVVTFLSRFTDWRPYEHRVLANTKWGNVPMPVNLDTLASILQDDVFTSVSQKLEDAFGYDNSVPVLRLRASDDPVLAELGEYLWNIFFEGYTEKMWGVPAEALSPGVTGRVPVRVSRDDRYFTDRFQAQPRGGYVAMVEAMLDHPNIAVFLGEEYKLRKPGAVVYTGPVDALFKYQLGVLPYRTIEFETTEDPKVTTMPSVATVNYPDAEITFTRETEMGVLTGSGVSVVVKETPVAFQPDANDPYYPVPMDENRAIHDRYVAAAGEAGLILAGRLADYKYYNMDQAVARGLSVAAQITGRKQ